MNYDFEIKQGATFNPRIQYAQPQLSVIAITGITNSGQAVVTATHGLTVDWPVYVLGVKGMTQINHQSADLDYISRAYTGYYVSPTSMRLDVDASTFGTYTSGGELLFHPPVSLSGCTARMKIKETLEDTVALVTLTTENGGITLGASAGTIDLLITATATAALTFDTGVYDLEVLDALGVVTRVIEGKVTLSQEVTTT